MPTTTKDACFIKVVCGFSSSSKEKIFVLSLAFSSDDIIVLVEGLGSQENISDVVSFQLLFSIY
jgi:hypothetical protein